MDTMRSLSVDLSHARAKHADAELEDGHVKQIDGGEVKDLN